MSVTNAPFPKIIKSTKPRCFTHAYESCLLPAETMCHQSEYTEHKGKGNDHRAYFPLRFELAAFNRPTGSTCSEL